MVAGLGEAAVLRVIGFYIARIPKPNSRAAYAVAVRGFFRWRGVHELSLVRRSG